jgi:hypothetical protein
MVIPALIAYALFASCASFEATGDPARPRVANLYGSGLGWADAEEGMAYWPKLGLIVGGGADWHYDFAAPERAHSAALAASRADAAMRANPALIVLPYVDAIESPDNPSFPSDFWLRGEDGARVSDWPGLWRIDTENEGARSYLRGGIVQHAFGNPAWSGVFIDRWEPDGLLIPGLRAAARGRIIMTNSGWLPETASALVNGALSEDELNSVADGTLDPRELMRRYRDWMRHSAKPATTTLCCHPRGVDTDPWAWAELSEADRESTVERHRQSDPAMLRFGLCFALMGDGFFAYDLGTMQRGQWWWYPEYDAPLGHPLGDCAEARPRAWTRAYEGAIV